MVLTVPFESYGSSCAHLDIPRVAWIARVGGRVRITSADPARSLLVRCDTGMGLEACRSHLAGIGFECRDGLWSSEAESEAQPTSDFWVAAVSYRSKESRPGLWVDALPHRPVPGEVLSAMYEEFRASGELEGVEFEAFIKEIEPNLLILDPDEQVQFALRHTSC
jgi:hypothetical protein